MVSAQGIWSSSSALVGTCNFLLILFISLVLPGELPAAPFNSDSEERAAQLIAPLEKDSVLHGGYVIEKIGPIDHSSITITIRGGSDQIDVKFSKRNDNQPAFIRTTNCNVLYVTEGNQESATSEALDRAIRHLAKAASVHDGVCADLHKKIPEEPRSLGARLPSWKLVLLILLLCAVLAAAFSAISPRASPRQGEAVFFASILIITAAGAVLRMYNICAPFLEGAYPERVEIASGPLWQLLTMQRFDHHHPPMTSLLLRLMLVFGRDEYLLRLPFVVFSILFLPAMALLGKRTGGPFVGTLTCFGCAVVWPLVDAGSQISPHAMFVFAVALVLLSHLKFREKPTLLNGVVLVLTNTFALWAHYFSVFLLLIQALDFATLPRKQGRDPLTLRRFFMNLRRMFRPSSDGAEGPGTRVDYSGTLHWCSIMLTVLLSGLPLMFFLKGILSDLHTVHRFMGIQNAWIGAGRFLQITWQQASAAGPLFSSVVVVFALLGSAEIIRRHVSTHSAAARFMLWMTVLTWSLPLFILFLLCCFEPIYRTNIQYVAMTLPLLVLIAVYGAVHVPAVVLSRIFRGRVALSNVLGRGLGWALAVSIACTAAWNLRAYTAPNVFGEASEASIPEIARIVKSKDIRHIASIFGYSRHLLGYYLMKDSKGFEEFTLGSEPWSYGPYVIHALCADDDRNGDCRETAPAKFKEILNSFESLWLLDYNARDIEAAWLELLAAGDCRVQQTFHDTTLMLCRRRD